MRTRTSSPPWDFLQQASATSLQHYELSRLNNAANLRREIAALLDQWIEDNSQALLARWLHDWQCRPPIVPLAPSPQTELPFDHPLPPSGPGSVRLARRAASAIRRCDSGIDHQA